MVVIFGVADPSSLLFAALEHKLHLGLLAAGDGGAVKNTFNQ